MDQHHQIQLWKDYFLQNHHIAFIRNDPDTIERPQSSKTGSENPSPVGAWQLINKGNPPARENSEPPHSSLYARKAAVEILLSDQRKTLYESHRQELLREQEDRHSEISRHLAHIEKLLQTVSQLEKTVAR